MSGKLFKSKLFVGLLCILLAVGISFAAIPALNRAKTATKEAVRLRVDVPQGATLTSEMLTVSEVGAYGLPEGIAGEAATVVGMTAKENLYAGELLWQERLQTKEEYQEEEAGRSLGLSGGKRLVTVKLPSPSSGVAGILRAGNTVDVYEYIEEENEDGEESCFASLVQSSLVVYDVLNNDLESLTSVDEQLEAIPEGETVNLDFAPCYIVFRCSEVEARELIRLERAGSMHLVLRKTGA